MTSEIARLDEAIRTAAGHLLSLRCEGGYWEGRLSSSALATATAISALSVAGQDQDRDLIRQGRDWLAADQNPDGGWGDSPDSPSNLATSLLGLAAITLAPPELARGATTDRVRGYLTPVTGSTPEERVRAIRAAYGKDRTFAVPILANLALAGLVPWGSVPRLPYELAVFPQGLYRLLRLHVVSYALPALIAVGRLIERNNPARNPVQRAVRQSASAPVARKLIALQPESGGFLEATPLTAFVTMSVAATDGVDGQVARKGLQFLRASMRGDGSWPIDTNLATWITTNATLALDQAGPVIGLQAAAKQAGAWVAAQQSDEVHPFTGARPGGWAWTDLSGGVPDADDTSGALIALADHLDEAARSRGVKWLLDLQNSDGGWPTFCRGWGHLPFDQSCPDITAHVLRALNTGSGAALWTKGALGKALWYLGQTQREDGSWLPLWFGNQLAPQRQNPVLGTARVILALSELVVAGNMPDSGIKYLHAAQNPDGGWGGAPGMASTVEETALAVSALSGVASTVKATGHPVSTLSHVGPENESLHKGVYYLIERVENGTWTQPAPIGLYFSSLWYSEALYPVVWTLEALSRARRAMTSHGQQACGES